MKYNRLERVSKSQLERSLRGAKFRSTEASLPTEQCREGWLIKGRISNELNQKKNIVKRCFLLLVLLFNLNTHASLDGEETLIWMTTATQLYTLYDHTMMHH